MIKYIIQLSLLTLLLASLQTAWGQRQVTLQLREVEVSEKSEGPGRKIHHVLEVNAAGGESFYTKAIHGDSRLLFRGKLTELPDRVLKIEYQLDQSFLDGDSSEPLKLKGTSEVSGAYPGADDFFVLENSDSRPLPDDNQTQWELRVYPFHLGIGYLDWHYPRLNFRLVDEEGTPVKGALVYVVGYLSGGFAQGADDHTYVSGPLNPSDDNGIAEGMEGKMIPLGTIVAEHKERKLIGTAHIERSLDAPIEDPHIVKMREWVPEDEGTWYDHDSP